MTQYDMPAPLTRAYGSNRGSHRRDPRPGASIFVPALLLALAVVAGVGFQTLQLARERQQLGLAKEALQPQMKVATTLRAGLDSLATSTARLATDGNANARTVVEELRRRGVTINPTGAAQKQ